MKDDIFIQKNSVQRLDSYGRWQAVNLSSYITYSRIFYDRDRITSLLELKHNREVHIGNMHYRINSKVKKEFLQYLNNNYFILLKQNYLKRDVSF